MCANKKNISMINLSMYVYCQKYNVNISIYINVNIHTWRFPKMGVAPKDPSH